MFKLFKKVLRNDNFQAVRMCTCVHKWSKRCVQLFCWFNAISDLAVRIDFWCVQRCVQLFCWFGGISEQLYASFAKKYQNFFFEFYTLLYFVIYYTCIIILRKLLVFFYKRYVQLSRNVVKSTKKLYASFLDIRTAKLKTLI